MTILLGWNSDRFDPIEKENIVFTYLQKAIEELKVGKIVYVGGEKKYPALEVNSLQDFLNIMTKVDTPFSVNENWYKDKGFSQCTNIIIFE